MRSLVLGCVLAMLAAPLVAQDSPASGLRKDIAALQGVLQGLQADLAAQSTSGTAVSGSVLDRVNAIETELRRLTAKTEELEFRVGQVVRDGTNRLGDLEFRVCELEPGCDIGDLGRTSPLGGGTAAETPGTQTITTGPELAVGEASDFDAAKAALDRGEFDSAAAQFARFRETYPGSPLEAQALLGRGKALDALGDTREAARAFLDAFSAYPESDTAPEALRRLGLALGGLGKKAEACVTLSEVAFRFPASPEVAEASQNMSTLGCS